MLEATICYLLMACAFAWISWSVNSGGFIKQGVRIYFAFVLGCLWPIAFVIAHPSIK